MEKFMTGIIKFYNQDRGFGFIDCGNLDRDVFFHRTEVDGEAPSKDDRVEFEHGITERGPIAKNIRILGGSETPPVTMISVMKKIIESTPKPEKIRNWRERKTESSVKKTTIEIDAIEVEDLSDEEIDDYIDSRLDQAGRILSIAVKKALGRTG